MDVKLAASDPMFMYSMSDWTIDNGTARTTSNGHMITFIARSEFAISTSIISEDVLVEERPNVTITLLNETGHVSDWTDCGSDCMMRYDVVRGDSSALAPSFTFRIEGINFISGPNFLPQSWGRNATLVPSFAKTVENDDPVITYSNEVSCWARLPDVYMITFTRGCSVIGASMSYSWKGTAVWWFGSVNSQANLTFILDGRVDEHVRLNYDIWPRTQKLLWSSVGLPDTEHNLTVVLNEPSSEPRGFPMMSFDWLRIEGESLVITSKPPQSSESTNTSRLGGEPTGDPQVISTAPLKESDNLLAILAGALGGASTLFGLLLLLFARSNSKRGLGNAEGEGTLNETQGAVPQENNSMISRNSETVQVSNALIVSTTDLQRASIDSV